LPPTYYPVATRGALGATLSFLHAICVFFVYLFGNGMPRWNSTAVRLLVLGGLPMAMLTLGVLGKYFARMLDEVRQRPGYAIERMSSTLRGPVADRGSSPW